MDIYLSDCERIYLWNYYFWIYKGLKMGFITVDLTEVSCLTELEGLQCKLEIFTKMIYLQDLWVDLCINCLTYVCTPWMFVSHCHFNDFKFQVELTFVNSPYLAGITKQQEIKWHVSKITKGFMEINSQKRTIDTTSVGV